MIQNALSYRPPMKAILPCPVCRQGLAASLADDKKVTLRCPACRHEFTFERGRRRRKERAIALAIVAFSWGLLLLDITLPFVLIPKANSAPQHSRKQYEDAMQKRGISFEKELEAKKLKYAEEIRKLNLGQLRSAAEKHYAAIWERRMRFDDKFAVTPREKAQLEMLALSKRLGAGSPDKPENMETILKQIAAKAAPPNSKIDLIPSEGGYRLDIDFDMSELASGEKGTQTTHSSIESLRNEVIQLNSRVMNDVYQFCGKMELASISIGLRHQVREMVNGNYERDATTVLYKIRLDRRNLQELKDNPFLNTYSTAQDFRVVRDDFPNLTLVPER